MVGEVLVREGFLEAVVHLNRAANSSLGMLSRHQGHTKFWSQEDKSWEMLTGRETKFPTHLRKCLPTRTRWSMPGTPGRRVTTHTEGESSGSGPPESEPHLGKEALSL